MSNPRVGLIIIATGAAYNDYAWNLIESARIFFPEAMPFVFTNDALAYPSNVCISKTQPKGYPLETLFRYETILERKEILVDLFDHIFYIDADMEFVERPNLGHLLVNGLVATRHPGYHKLRQWGDPERRVESNAFLTGNTAYYAGGFQGGATGFYLKAAAHMAVMIRDDYKRGITAKWHDESHWNKYLHENPPTVALDPSYCYTEDYHGEYGWNPSECPPIIMALDKHKRGNHPRPK